MTSRAVVLVAHGSHAAVETNRMIQRHADTIAEHRIFDEVAVAFHQGQPGFGTVVDQLQATDITIVPVMTSDGYYVNEVVPRELAANRRFKECKIHFAPPIGVHRNTASLLADRCSTLLDSAGLDPDQTAVMLVGHGTRRNPRSRLATVALAQRLGAQQVAAEVCACFIDDDPTVAVSLAEITQPTVLVLPFMIGLGPHVTEDIPQALGVSGTSTTHPTQHRVGERTVVVDMPFGAYPQLADLILATASEHAKQPRRSVLRLGTRSTPMALWQAHHVAALLSRCDRSVDIVELSTVGDRVLDQPIADLPGAAPFASELEQALLDERIDLAVHSLKDLSVVDADPRLTLAAILRRQDPHEAVVSRTGVGLDQLPTGAVIGTSSLRRTAQVRHLRPDLTPATVRGPVDQRIAALDRGEYDAVILAVAGLQRLGLDDRITEVLPARRFMPAPAQGALAIQVRTADHDTRRLCETLDDQPTRRAVTAELAFLRPYESDPSWIAAAYATAPDLLEMQALLIVADGTQAYRARVQGHDPLQVSAEALRIVEHRRACEAEGS